MNTTVMLPNEISDSKQHLRVHGSHSNIACRWEKQRYLKFLLLEIISINNT